MPTEPTPEGCGLSPTQFNALAPHYDELMDLVPYEAWAEYVMLLCDVNEHTPRRLLDCACGTGNLSFELAHLGLDVTGVDISAAMIDVARGKAKLSPFSVRFLEGDLTHFALGETFDTATCLFDSLNYILDPNALARAFVAVAQHLEPAGLFVFDLNSEHALTTDLFTQSNHWRKKALTYDWHANYDPATKVTTVAMEFVREGSNGTTTRFSEEHRERAYSLVDIETMVTAAGLELVRSYNAYTLNRPHEASERWFFVARRP